MKKMIAIITMVLVIGTGSIVFADGFKSMGEIVADLTGKPVSEVYTERSNGKTFGTIADENGKLEQFKQQMLEQKETILDQRVSEGYMTKETADKIYESIQNNIEDCNGTRMGIGRRYNAGFGRAMNRGQNGNSNCGFGGCGMNSNYSYAN